MLGISMRCFLGKMAAVPQGRKYTVDFSGELCRMPHNYCNQNKHRLIKGGQKTVWRKRKEKLLNQKEDRRPALKELVLGSILFNGLLNDCIEVGVKWWKLLMTETWNASSVYRSNNIFQRMNYLLLMFSLIFIV